MNSQRIYVPRTLSWIEENREKHFVSEVDILTNYSRPIVILGEPGMGKTLLMKKLGSAPDWVYFRATTFLRQQENSIQESFQLIIDGLDEVAAMEDGDPLHNMLKKLVACGNPRFIISCRVAEWRGATARIDIEEHYGHTPIQLSLVPLTKEEATEILIANDVGTYKAKESIDQLCSSGLETFFQNPLNLEFIASTLKKQSNLPETTADLLNYATIALCQEPNEIHVDSLLTMLSKEEVLDVAGCLMATMLLAGKEGISQTHDVSGTFKLSEISDLTNVEKAKAVLSSRLFQILQDPSVTSEDPVFFIPLHRKVAEFLGARWLATQIEKTDNSNRVARRLLGLISASGGVPASLRGLHAWLPKFSPEPLGPKVIAQDPYGILRYGDGDHLTVGQACQIIQDLRQLALYDPFFRYDWREALSIKGLAHIELVNEIRAVVRNPDEPPQLRSLLLDAIRGDEIAVKMIPDLQNIVMDATREFAEREKASVALMQIDDPMIDWPSELRRLSALSDNESNRLVIQLIPKIGIDRFNEEQIAEAVVAHVGIPNRESDDNSFTSYKSLRDLETNIPDKRIKALLIQLTRIVSKFRDSETWWLTEYDRGSRRLTRFTRYLVSSLLKHDSRSVQPEQLWNWIRVLWSGQESDIHSTLSECELIADNDRLRIGIQRLALFTPGAEDYFQLKHMHLRDFCQSFGISPDDAQVHLSNLVERNDPAERRRWCALVNICRSADDKIPKHIQKIARPYAEGDPELIDLLTKKPNLSDWEKKHRQQQRNLERRKKKNIADARKHYSLHIDEIRSGELQWILQPAQAYFGMFRDLETDCEPSERISKWLGDDICQASLIGFEAVLNRSDLPSTNQIVEGYANSRVWYFAFPMLAAAGQRFLSGNNFEDMPTELVISLAILAEHESSILSEKFSGLLQILNVQLQQNCQSYETYLRQKFELMLTANVSHIPGLYQFLREDTERPLSTQLSLEWLNSFPNLPRKITNELVDCIISAPNSEREQAWGELSEIVGNRLDELIAIGQSNQDESDLEEEKIWRSAQFLINFETAVNHIPDITEENKDWLWSLTNKLCDNHYHQIYQTIPVTVEQLKWIVVKFRKFWPRVGRPGGVMTGVTNPWDAAELLVRSIFQIAKDPSDEAALALSELREMPIDSYTNHVLSAIAQNRRSQIEASFKSPTISQIKAVLTDGRPGSPSDVQSIVLEELSELQGRLRGHPLNPVNNFYSDEGVPRHENECRDQMLIAMGKLPYNIQFPAEFTMPQGKRSDIAFTFDEFVIPLETKGQWHRNVWAAATDQLDRYYCKTSKSASKGIYVVFWFGKNVPPGKRIKPPPNGGQRPESPEDMRVALQARIPLERQTDIEVVVLDVTRE